MHLCQGLKGPTQYFSVINTIIASLSATGSAGAGQDVDNIGHILSCLTRGP